MKIAIVDIGSNTIKMKIYEYKNNSVCEIFSKVENSKLISYIQNGVMNTEGITLLCNIVSNFKHIAEQRSSDIFKCFATASLRRTQNIQNILSNVNENCSANIDLISGDDEAFLSFSGVKHNMHDFPKNGIMIDMGGGSTEVVCFENKNIISSSSMNFGSLSLFLDFIKSQKDTPLFDIVKQYAFDMLDQENIIKQKYKNAILVGGTALAIYKLYCCYFDTNNEKTMTYTSLEKLYNILKKQENQTLELLKKIVPDRIYTVIPGLSAYLGLFSLCGTEKISVSTFGIREGYVHEKILKNIKTARDLVR